MEYKKNMYFLFKIVLFLVNYHECYFVFIEFEYHMKIICLDDESFLVGMCFWWCHLFSGISISICTRVIFQ